jgi:hypothetical protein
LRLLRAEPVSAGMAVAWLRIERSLSTMLLEQDDKPPSGEHALYEAEALLQVEEEMERKAEEACSRPSNNPVRAPAD